ncbi:LLM class oxidoreductase [Paenalcaligenes hominis]|uniref:LLM class oxidoreductase n=1 Tax=Paenalcaligenes hominis TaxID=643674 RepID=UPI0035243B5E
MLSLSSLPYSDLPGFCRTYSPNQLTLGLYFPIEAYAGDAPLMHNQVALAQQAEQSGFASLWFRDVPLRDPSFGDLGQVYDPWVYLGYIAGQTSRIALGTGAIVVPIRHPLHMAKAAASIDQLSGGRLLLGVASGDRPAEYPAFNVDADTRGERFVEHLSVMRQALSTHFEPVHWDNGEMLNTDLVPKPLAREIPLFITGSSRQTLQWIARESHGWLSYPRPLHHQKDIVKRWHDTVRQECGEVFKPFSQGLYIDLTADPNVMATPIHLGFRLGRNALIELLQLLRSFGVNHVMLQLKYGQRPAQEVLDELAEFVVPQFPALA